MGIMGALIAIGAEVLRFALVAVLMLVAIVVTAIIFVVVAALGIDHSARDVGELDHSTGSTRP
jgi:cell division protein FtsL